MSCPREIEIDRLIGGSLEGAEASALESHISACPACAAERDRARKEAEAYRRRLAPLRLSGGIKEEIMASLPETLPAPTPVAPRFGIARWAAAAAILVAVLTAVLFQGRPAELPTPAQEPKHEDIRVLSMSVRRSTSTWSMQAPQALMVEELPHVAGELERAGLWTRTEMLKAQVDDQRDPARTVGLAIVVERNGVRESWTFHLAAYPSQSSDWKILVDGPRKGEADLSKEAFDRLWSILDRAMNPLQIYAGEPSKQYWGLPLWYTLVCREHLEGGDPAKVEAMLVLRRTNGTPSTLSTTVLFDPAPTPQVPFASVMMFTLLDTIDRPGRYAIHWTCGRHASPDLELPEIDKAYWEKRKGAGEPLPLAEALEAGRKENKPVLCYFYFKLKELMPGLNDSVPDWPERVAEALKKGMETSFGGTVVLARQDAREGGKDLRVPYGIEQLRLMDFVLLLDPHQADPPKQILVQALDLSADGVRKAVDAGLIRFREHASVAPSPAGDERDYLPTKAGMKLVYLDEDNVEEVVTVKGIRDLGDVDYVAIKFKNRVDYYRVTAEGIFLCGVDLETGSSGDYRKNPMLPFKFGTAKGDKWTFSDPNVSVVHENCGEEVVEVPAGKFSAVKIVSTSTAKAMNITRSTTEWWARGVGVVKRTMAMGPTTWVKVLKKVD